MSALVISSSAANGSSISRIGLPSANARTSATRCCMPPESSCGRASQEVAEAHLAEQVDMVRGRARGGGRVGPAIDVEQQAGVGLDGAPWQQRRGLRDEADHLRRPGAARGGVADGDRPGARRLEPGHHPQQRRLAAAARTEQGDDLTRPDLEVGRREHVEIAERLGDVFEPDDGGHAAPRRGSSRRSTCFASTSISMLTAASAPSPIGETSRTVPNSSTIPVNTPGSYRL